MLLFSVSDPLEIAGVKGGKSLIVPKTTLDRAVRADTWTGLSGLILGQGCQG